MQLKKRGFVVRRLEANELTDVLELTWRVFEEFEAPDYGPEGESTFYHEIIKGADFHKACQNGTNLMWGAFVDGTLAGTVVVKGKSHLSLLFVDKEYHRMGIGTALLQAVVDERQKVYPNLHRITVNASPYGKVFYRQFGFQNVDEEQVVNGIRFTPMQYIIETKE